MLRIFSVIFFCLFSWQSVANQAVETSNAIVEKKSEVNAEFISNLSPILTKLTKTKLSKLSPLVKQIAEIPAPQVKFILQSLLDGQLYYLRSNKQVVNAQRNENKLYNLSDILTGEVLTPVKSKLIKKIKTNNKLRSQIRTLLAQMDLTNKNKTIRIDAVKQLLDKPNKEALAMVVDMVKKESDSDVRELMNTTIFVNQLINGNNAEKIAATLQLKNSLEPAVKNAMTSELTQLKESTELSKEVGKETSTEEKVLIDALTKALESINSKVKVFGFIENIFFGLSLGSVLLLAAIGLAITFGVMGVINMAHGEMMMLGAYTTYVIQQMFPQLIDYSLLMAVPAAFLVSGFVGVLIERGVIRHLKGRPLETLLATFGISLILQQLVRTVFSPLNRQVSAPEWMSGSWQINPVFSLTFNRLYIIIFSLMVFIALLMILKKTSLGLHVRAVSQNRDMARALSIKSDWVDAITFGLGSGIAGVAGVVLSQLTNVGPNLGQAYIIDSFLVVVFGGVGNLWGTLVAAMSLGTINKFLEPVTGSVLANIIVLVGLVLFIQKRPKGLFPQKGRSAD